jgi:hypothetical protein
MAISSGELLNQVSLPSLTVCVTDVWVFSCLVACHRDQETLPSGLVEGLRASKLKILGEGPPAGPLSSVLTNRKEPRDFRNGRLSSSVDSK